ncbi:MAG: leucine-rich repeat protein, partial [Muribaculaceae bacterium]|nr:leucine-rich repeat protein [Muribaculaceae bacterium]
GAKSYSNLQIPERFTDDTDTANPVRYNIKGIGYKAFYKKDVTSVEFNSRSKMEYIGDYAFANTNISSITLPETMKNIGDYAFEETGLTSIDIPKSIKSIGDYAFFNTTKLHEIKLQEGLESIGAYSFAAEKGRSIELTPIYMPSSVQTVGMYAFRNYECSKVEISDLTAWLGIDFGSITANPLCGSENGLYVNGEQLTKLQVPEGLKEVKSYSFYNCKSLQEVILPKGLEIIGSYCFYNCQSLQEVILPKGLEIIGSRCFYNCTFLQKVILPEGLEIIGSNCFYNCSNVAEVTIPSSVMEIGYHAFVQNKVTFSDGLLPISLSNEAIYAPKELYWGRPLESLTLSLEDVSYLGIGSLITEIPDGKFKNLKNLKSVSLGNSVETIGNEAFSGCTALAEIILPPSVETIEASAFAGNSSLNSIIMGHKVKNIGDKAFDGCKANTVSITAQTPPTASNTTFSNYSGKLYVQGEKAKDAYYDAFTCWDRFDSYVMIDAEEIKIEGADKISGKAGDTFQLTATVWPENATLPQIFWRSTNPEIATVDVNGLVTLHVDLESLNTRAQGEGDIDGVCSIIAETLYNDGPVAQVAVDENGLNAVESIPIGDNGTIDYTLPYEVFNMNGLKVSDTTEGLANGIYIIRQGKAVVKTVVR